MHLFRWARFLSWKGRGRRPSSPRRSSRWLLRHFHRRRSSRGSSLSAPSIEALSVSSTFDLRPSVIYLDQPADVGVRRSSLSDEDRKFIDGFPRVHNGSFSPTNSHSSAATLARVSSLFHTTGRSTLLDRASMANLFNQLQFEMPPLPPNEPVPLDTIGTGPVMTANTGPTSPLSSKKKTRSQKRLAKRKLKKMQRAANLLAADNPEATPGDPEQVLARTEPSFFRQYMLRAKSRNSMTLEDPKFRPLTMEQCHAYIQSVVLNASTMGSRGFETPPLSPVREPVEFLFFGGCSEENPHRLREVDGETRRLRARFVASQPTPSFTSSIHIKPTLVRGLPSVFEPRFETMYL